MAPAPNGGSPRLSLAPTRLGRYRIERRLAHGGMAEVYLGREQRDQEGDLDAPVRVIKCLLPELTHEPEFVAMFLNEAQLMAQLKHRNLVRVYDFGEDQGRLYQIMEYVDGLDCWRFARRLHPWGRRHTPLAIWIVAQVLQALEHVHAARDVNNRPLHVIHRDLSPSNIYLSAQGQVKLGDFGIARIRSQRYRPVSMIPRGKFGYVAPELVEGKEVDQRADIFAAGIVLSELVIGKKLFSGASQLSVMLEIREGRLETLKKNVESIEPELLEILHRALARDPDERYESAGDFRMILESYLRSASPHPNAIALGEQVRRAVEVGHHSSLPDATDGQTPKTHPGLSIPAREEPTAPGEVTRPTSTTPSIWDRDEPTAAGEGGPTPTTLETSAATDARYTAHLADNRTVGPISYAHMIELICAEEVGPETLVSLAGSPYVPASSYPELNRHLPAYTPTTSLESIDPPDLRGTLDVDTISSVILRVAAARQSGLLICKHLAKRKEIYFEDGTPIYVTSNNPRELLGEYLVSRDAISRADLDVALALLPKFNGHLGDTFIALGMLSAMDLLEHIGNQIHARFVDTFDWREGRYEFYDNRACRPDVLEIPIDVWSVVPESLLERAADLPASETVDALRPCLVEPGPNQSALLAASKLPERFDGLLNEAERTPRVDEFVEQTDRALATLRDFLFVAIETGLLTLKGPTPPWRLRGD